MLASPRDLLISVLVEIEEEAYPGGFPMNGETSFVNITLDGTMCPG